MAEHKYLLQREGDLWIAAAPGYLDLSESPVGRGSTQEEAVEDLKRQPEFQLWLRENDIATPALADFEVNEGGRVDLTFIDADGKRHRTNPSTY